MADTKPAPDTGKKPPMTDAEFFSVPDMQKQVVTEAKKDMPGWYTDWLSPDKLKQDFMVWHDSWPAIEIFTGLQTQWRISYDGVTGLDYTAVIAVIALYHPRRADQACMLQDLQALEMGAMTAFNEQRAAAREKTT